MQWIWKISTDHHAIFTLRLDGTGLRRLTPWKLDAASPDWSPRGGWIAFRTHETSGSRGDIGLVRPRGKHLHFITSDAGSGVSSRFRQTTATSQRVGALTAFISTSTA
jgi:Tol biopolymer transport system component